MQQFIVGLDIGSHTIKAAVGELKKGGKPSVVRLIKMPSQGMRKGVVDDLTEVAQSLSAVLFEIKKVSKSALKNVFLGIGGPDVKVQTSNGAVAVSRSDSEIYQDDVNRAIQGSQAVTLPPNRMVIHFLVKEYVVDGVRDIRDPLGMTGNRLEVNSLVIDGFAPAIKNATKCVEMLGGGLGNLILSPLASARAILTKRQKDLGVALVDIGFGKTGISIYEENRLLHSAIFPIGSGNVTNDLAIGLKTAVETAEAIKLSFGTALAKEVSVREMVELQKIDSRLRGTVSKKFISDIIEVRLAEIFEFVNNELKTVNKTGRLPAGVVLVGGGAKCPGIVDLARQELKLAAQVGIPDLSELVIPSGELALQAEDPEFACAVGLLLWGSDQSLGKKTQRSSLGNSLRNVFRYFVP